MYDAANPAPEPAYDPNDAHSVAEYVAAKLNPPDEGATSAEPAVSETAPTEGGTDDLQATEAPDQPKAPAPSEPEPKYKVKVRGEEREVPLSELLNGYSRTEDYKVKTAEVADQRRAVEAERNQLLPRLTQAIDQAMAFDPIITEGQRTDWAALAQQDPAAYVQRFAQYQQRVALVNGLAEQRDQMVKAQQAEQLARANEALAAAVPEWADEGKRATMVKDLSDGLSQHYGYSADDLRGVSDHRALLVAMDAMKWRQHQASIASAQAKAVAPVPKVVKPGVAESGPRVNQQADALKARALRTGKTDDQVAAVLAALRN